MTNQELTDFAIELLQTGNVKEKDLIDFTIGLLQAGRVKEFNEFRAKYSALKEIDLSYADLRDVNLEGANLNGVNGLGAADLIGARFDKEQIAMLPRLLCIRVLEEDNE